MKKHTLYFILIILSAILLSGVASYFYLDGRVYSDGPSLSLTQAQAKEASDILDHLSPQDYNTKYQTIGQEGDSLSTYITILSDEQAELPDINLNLRYPPESRNTIKAQFSYSLEKAIFYYQVLTYCESRLKYSLTYDDYLQYIQAQAYKMNDVSLFNAQTHNNIQKTARDFALQEDILVTPNVTIGIYMLLQNPFSNAIAVSLSVLCAIVLSVWLVKSSDTFRTSSVRKYILLFLIGLVGIFVAELIAVDLTWELGDLSISAQSMTEFRTCRYPISIGTLIFLRTLAKCMACLILFLFSTACFCMGKGIFLWAGSLLTVGLIQKYLLNETLWDIKYCFQFEQLIGDYQNVFLWDTPVAAELIYGILLTLLLLVSMGFAARQTGRMILVAKEHREKAYFEEINNRYSEIRMLRHDMNNHFSAISLLLGEGKVKEAQTYLQHITADMASATPLTQTGVGALDLVLWNKLTSAQEQQIEIQADLGHSLSGFPLSDYEWCSLFGNLLDNAIEAVQKLPEAQRKIKISIGCQMDMLCIYCENPYATIRQENGALATLKGDHKNHGLGLKQIRRIASKYNGTVDIHTENQTFCISVLLTTSTPK